ncbi:hypothetical protein MTO96_035498 [Rhipicephalus appendiculatus]
MTKFTVLVLVFLVAAFTLISVAPSNATSCFGHCGISGMTCAKGCTCMTTKISVMYVSCSAVTCGQGCYYDSSNNPHGCPGGCQCVARDWGTGTVNMSGTCMH